MNYYDDAIIDFKKAIEIEIEQMKLNNHSQPFSFSTLTYYGRAKFEIKDYKGSLIIFFKCLEQHPKNHDTYELIAKVYEKLNDFENYALYMKKFNELNEKKLKNQSKTKSLKEVLITREANQERLKKVEELSNQALSSKQIEQLVNQMWLNHKRLFVNNRHTMQPEKKVLTMTENERARLQAFKNVMERIRPISQLENHEIKEEERKYFSEAHKKNSDGVMAHIAKSKTMEIDWEKELERQKWNSQDHENSIKESLAGNISREKTTNTDLTEKKTPKFQSKAHEENYKKATAYIAKSKTLEIDWEKELERQKRNSQDH